MKKILTSTKAKRFYWNTANGAIGIAITYFAQLNWIYAPIMIAVLNGLTKEINNRYL